MTRVIKNDPAKYLRRADLPLHYARLSGRPIAPPPTRGCAACGWPVAAFGWPGWAPGELHCAKCDASWEEVEIGDQGRTA